MSNYSPSPKSSNSRKETAYSTPNGDSETLFSHNNTPRIPDLTPPDKRRDFSLNTPEGVSYAGFDGPIFPKTEETKLYSDTSVHTIGLARVISDILGDIVQKVERWKEILGSVRETLDVEDHVQLYDFVLNTLNALMHTLEIDHLRGGDYLQAAGPEWLTKFNDRLTQLTEFLLKWLARFPQEDDGGFHLTLLVKVTKIVGSYAPRVVQYANHVQSSLSVLQAQRARFLAQKPITIRSTRSREKRSELRAQNSAH